MKVFEGNGGGGGGAAGFAARDAFDVPILFYSMQSDSSNMLY